MTEQNMIDVGIRKEVKQKFTGPDYTLGDKAISIGGSSLGGEEECNPGVVDGNELKTKAIGGKGESLGMSTQKPILKKMVTSEMGTVVVTG